MGKFILALVFLVIGAVIGFLGSWLVGGAAMGIGVATGASAGICMTVEAAEEEGLLTPEEKRPVSLWAPETIAQP